MNNRHIYPLFVPKEGQSEKIELKTPLELYEYKVRFSLSKCVTRKNLCISTVASNKNLLESLYSTLGKFESLTWQQEGQLTREKGISIEKKCDPMHKALSLEMPEASTFGHFRVNNDKRKVFRVFGARLEDLFYILYFDVDGNLQH